MRYAALGQAAAALHKLARDNEFLRLQVAEYRPVHGEV